MKYRPREPDDVEFDEPAFISGLPDDLAAYYREVSVELILGEHHPRWMGVSANGVNSILLCRILQNLERLCRQGEAGR